MIPQRLALSGFLTFRDEEVLRFGDANATAIVGENGHGKSALLDAIVYALYGVTRSARAEEMVSRGLSTLCVEFDFAVSGRRYRVRRTLTRQTGRRSGRVTTVSEAGVHEWAESEAGAGRWVGLPEAEGSRQCTAWATRVLGMNVEGLRSTILLGQNDQFRLLRATPTERQQIFNSILDLERYRKLEEAARERSRRAGKEISGLEARRRDLKPHDEATLERLRAELDVCRAEVGRRTAAFEQARDRHQDAIRYADLESRLVSVRQTMAELDELIARAVQVRANADRYDLLGQAIPLCRDGLDALTKAEQSEAAASLARSEVEQIDVSALRSNISEAVQTLQTVQDGVQSARAKRDALDEEERTLRPLGLALENADRFNEDANSFRTAAAKLDAQAVGYEALEWEAERLAELARDIPWLERLGAARGDIRQAALAHQAAEVLEHQALADINEARDSAKVAERRQKTATADLRTAESALHRQRAAMEHLQALLAARTDAVGEQKCSRCGSPIDEATVRAEISSLHDQLAKIDQRVRRAEEAVDGERAKEEAEESARRAATEAENEAKGKLASARAEAASVRAMESRATREHAAAMNALSPSARASAESDQSYPNAAILAEFRAESRKVNAVRSAATKGRTAHERRMQLLEQATEANGKATEWLAVVPDHSRATVRGRWGVLGEERAEAERSLRSAEKILDQARRAEGMARDALIEAERKIERLETAVTTEARLASEHREVAARITSRIPQTLFLRPLTESVLDDLCSEHDALAHAVADRAKLVEAERQRGPLAGEQRQLSDQLANIPDHHRMPVDDAKALREIAKCAADAANADERSAEYELRTATEDSETSAQIEAELRVVRTRKDDFDLLASLLSTRGLQGRLVEDAQIGIALGANQELQALSRGAMRLEMQRTIPKDGQEAGLALLVYDHASASEPFDAACLSGSQQFRVAVALALGIGQYVAGPTRGRRAVIIDEGFGSLDADGVAAMSEHLRALAGRLDRVILITHHTEMQRQFSHGFVVEKRDRTSRVHEWHHDVPGSVLAI